MIVNVIAEKDHQLKGQNQGKDCSIALESRLSIYYRVLAKEWTPQKEPL